MKLRILLLGGLVCLGAVAQNTATPQNNNSTQSANRVKRQEPMTGQSITGCVDEQNGHYVLRDMQTDKLITLKPSGTDADDGFARFVGHQAQATGTIENGTLTVTHIGQVADMCPIGK
jgi:hypothetical protein